MHGLEPISLRAKEGLALINGTQVRDPLLPCVSVINVDTDDDRRWCHRVVSRQTAG